MHRIDTAAFVLLALACVSPEARAATVGPEFRVNTTTANNQNAPSVAALSGGGFVVIWSSLGQDGSGYGIYGQRYSSAGSRIGGEFRVNTTTANNQTTPSAAALSGGGFVVAWSSFQQGPGQDIYAQRYTAAGARLGGEFRVNTTTANNQTTPSVAALSGGGFAVTWTSLAQDGSLGGVYGQRYTPAGVRNGGEFRVNSATARDQSYPSVAGLSGGGFVVVWSSEALGGQNVYGQRYTAAGARIGGEFRVNTTTANNQNDSSVAALSSGGFVVTWTSTYQDGSGDGVYGQRYDGAGTRVGGEFRVNTMMANNQSAPSVAALSGGGFVITWNSYYQDGYGYGVYGQRYSGMGVRVGGEFRVNSYTRYDQNASSVAALSGGGFVVTWTSSGQDGALSGVYAQRFSP